VQKYGIGIKELGQVPAEHSRKAIVMPRQRWPLDANAGGGSFLYHGGDNFVSVASSCISTTAIHTCYRTRISRGSRPIRPWLTFEPTDRELRALQDLRHQGSKPEYPWVSPEGRGGPNYVDM